MSNSGGAPPAGPTGSTADKAILTRAGVYRGMREIWPVAIYATIFGIAFGVAAVDAGMAGWAGLLMSMSVYAGGSQFAALEFWTSPIAWAPLLVATLGINGRHILLGASLYPWLSRLGRKETLLAAFLLSDPNWAKSLEARARGDHDAGILIGGGITLWLAWVLGTLLGIWLVDITPEQFHRFGLDLMFLCFLACVLTGLRRSRSDDVAWIAAAAAAIAAVFLLPANWHVLTGALLGGLAGMIVHASRRGGFHARP